MTSTGASPVPVVVRGSESGTVSVVIPVHNAESNLTELLTRLDAALASSTRNREIILVDDGSRDRSWELMAAAASSRGDVVAVRLRRNYGQHNAVLCGVRLARHAAIVTMDDDLQHPPEEIPRLLQALGPDTDVVYGSTSGTAHGLMRGLASRISRWTLQEVMGAEIARQVSPFRAFRRDLREAFSDYGGSFVSIDVLLGWATSRFAAVPVRHVERKRGESGYTFFKLVSHGFNMLTGFTVWPLQAASLLGFLLTIFGFLVLIYVVVRYLLEGTPAPGFPFLASLMSIFSGAQLFTLGVIGEYLARMHFRIMQKPTYSIRDRIGGGTSGRQEEGIA